MWQATLAAVVKSFALLRFASHYVPSMAQRYFIPWYHPDAVVMHWCLPTLIHTVFPSCFRSWRLRKPPVYTQPDKHGARRGDGHPPAPHAEHAFALSYDSFLSRQLRMPGHVCECTETDEGCAACKTSQLMLGGYGCLRRSVPTTRQGVQSSNWALSCFNASLKVGGGTSIAML